MGCGWSNQTDLERVSSSSLLERQKYNLVKIEHKVFVQRNKGKLENDYEVLEKIGSGHFGVVKKVVSKLNKEERAVKIIKKINQAKSKTALHEIDILRSLDHPHILKMCEFYEDENNYYVVMELLKGGELFEKISEGKCLTEKGSQEICRQILSSINYSHSLCIMHMDLKPENILLEIESNDEYNIKVIDWGGARRFKKGKMYSEYFGTKFYMSPEQFQQKYNFKCDLWSIGVILYILISGESPFGSQNIQKEIMNKNYKFYKDSWSHISDECIDLVKKLMCDQDVRLTAQEALNHPWFSKKFESNLSNQLSSMSIITRKPSFLEIKDEQKKNLTKLRKFQSSQKFQVAVLNYIAFKLISTTEYNYLREQFKKFDLNGDGTLTKKEIIEASRQICSKKELNQINFEEMFEQIDIDNNGVINFTEFISATMDKQNAKQKEKLKSTFDYFDQDKNGYITKDELSKILGGGTSDGEKSNFVGLWELILKQSDKNSDGQIEFYEFENMMNMYALENTPVSIS